MFFRNTFQCFHRLTSTISRSCNSIDRSRREHIETLDCSRARCILRCTQSCQRNHLTAACPNKEKSQTLFIRTIRCLCLNVNTVNTIKHIEIVHIHRSQISFHSREDVSHWNPQELRMISIYIKVNLRNIRLHCR